MTSSDGPEPGRVESEALSWLTRFSLGEVTREDLAALKAWRDASPDHAAALARAGQLWRDLHEPVAALAGEAPGRAAEGVRFRPSRRAVLTAGGTALAAATAGAVVLRPPLGLWPSLAELSADHRTAVGEQQHLALADAVSVELNTRTSISMRPVGQEPGLELVEGEAAVAVNRDASQPFVVVADEGRTFAHRATFNVRWTGPAVELTCIDGEIAVRSDRSVTLQGGQQVSYDRSGLRDVIEVDPAVVTAWRDGMLVFRNTPLSEVVEEVNRYRSGRIILVDRRLGRKLVTARFEINRLDTVVGQIGNVFKVPVRTFPAGLVLLG